MWAIFKKEFKSFFYSPIGYIIIGIFLFVFSCLFYFFAISNRSINLGSIYFGTALYGMPIITAALTMRSFAGEKSKGTDQLLYISPKRTITIVLGKFFSLVSIVCIGLILSIIYFIILSLYGNPSIGNLLTVLLGFILLSMAYISFGVMVSSTTGNQISSAIITLIFLILPLFFSINNEILSYIFLIDFFEKFVSGVISLREVVCLLSFTVMCITITTLGIKKRRN